MKGGLLSTRSMSAVMMSMMTLGGKRKSLDIQSKQEKLKGNLLLKLLMMRMMTTTMMTMETCRSMICGEMMKRQQRMLKMAKKIHQSCLSEKSPIHRLDPGVGHTLGIDPEIGRRDLKGLGHLAPPVALVHQDPEVEVETMQEAVNQDRKNLRAEESVLDHALGENLEKVEAPLPPPVVALGPDRDTRRRREPGDAPIQAQVAAVHAQDRDLGGQEEEEIGQGFSHFFTFTVIPSHVLKDAVKCFA